MYVKQGKAAKVFYETSNFCNIDINNQMGFVRN